eukprot:Opistho-2@88704
MAYGKGRKRTSWWLRMREWAQRHENSRMHANADLSMRAVVMAMCAIVALSLADAAVGYSTHDATCAARPPPRTTPPIIKIAFLFNGEISDYGWSFEGNKGKLYVQERLREKALIEYSIVPDTERDKPVQMEALRAYVQRGFDLIFAHSYGYYGAVIDTAALYRNVSFVHTGGGTVPAVNVASLYMRMYQARYLTGLVAGSMTNSNQICYVAAKKVPDVYGGLNAFAIGVRRVNPNATVHVIWSGDWFDPPVENAAANSAFDRTCCDIVGQHQDSAEPLKAAIKRGKYGIGFHSRVGAILGENILTSAVWNWGPLFYEFVERRINNTWIPNYVKWPGLAEGPYVQIEELSFAIPFDVSALVERELVRLSASVANDDIFCGPMVNRRAGECMNDTELNMFEDVADGPITGHGMRGYVENLLNLGSFVMPAVKCGGPGNGCSDRGVCTAGVCSCYSGYEGPECETSSASAPIGVIVGATVGGIAGLVCVSAAVFLRWSGHKTSRLVAEARNCIIDPKEIYFDTIIGQGAYGKVYKGRWRGSVVAIKTLLGTSLSTSTEQPWSGSRKSKSASEANSSGAMNPLPLHPPRSSAPESVASDCHVCDDEHECAPASVSVSAPVAIGTSDPNAYAISLAGAPLFVLPPTTSRMIGHNTFRNLSLQQTRIKPRDRVSTLLEKIGSRLFSSRSSKAEISLIHEIETMTTLRHPNIVLFMGASVQHPNVFVVTEFMENGSLMDLFTRDDLVLDWKLRLDLALDGAKGMAYIHSSSLLHLDLKSPNLLVDDRMRLKVADFGLATLKSVTSEKKSACGTLLWMAPELMTQPPTVTEKADVYSFGIIMHEILVFAPPYTEEVRSKGDEEDFMVSVISGA